MAKKETIKSFVLRVDAETMEAIEKWAADEFRSTNGQLQWIIAEALRKNGRMKIKKAITKSADRVLIDLSEEQKDEIVNIIKKHIDEKNLSEIPIYTMQDTTCKKHRKNCTFCIY